MEIDALIESFMWFVAAVAIAYGGIAAAAVMAVRRGDRMALIPAIGYSLCSSAAAGLWIHMMGS